MAMRLKIPARLRTVTDIYNARLWENMRRAYPDEDFFERTVVILPRVFVKNSGAL
jgi:hypothetical protein